MGADNWATCPQCFVVAVEAKQAERATTEAAYGKIPIDEFLKLKALSDTPLKVDQQLGEYYEIGIGDDGKFIASYTGTCRGCGFEFKFKEERIAFARSEAKP